MRLIHSLGVTVVLFASQVFAEPYLALLSNQPCSSCHVNQTGGGLRTQFGSIYAQTNLPAEPAENPAESITSLFDQRLLLGANARGSARIADVDGQNDVIRFETDRVTVYMAARVNPYMTLYIDQQFAPAGSLNREAFAMLAKGDWYLKAGKFYLPYGWRLEDDTAFIRQSTGINFNSPDNGVEVGYQRGHWNIQASFTNGSAGASEVNDGKQGSFRGEYIGNMARIGISANHNNTDFVDRTMYGVFAGLRTGDIGWLLEWDRIEDRETGRADREMDVALLEANYRFLKGHNLKITFEGLLPDTGDEKDIFRGSILWEFSPWPFTQLRAGYRQYDSNDDRPLNNREEAFIQLHLFF